MAGLLFIAFWCALVIAACTPAALEELQRRTTMPTYAAFDDSTNTLYVLRPTQCIPEEHAFNNGTDALDWLHVNTPSARTIPLLSFHGLLGVRQDRCDEDLVADNT